MTERKLFTAELQRLKAQQQQRGGGGGHEFSGSLAGSDVMRTLQELRTDIKMLEALIRGEPLPAKTAEPSVEMIEEMTAQKIAEVQMLKTELRALAVCIEQTKAEIAALRPRDSDDDRLIAVTYELDAIVTSTEGATQSILEASEKIDGLARSILSHSNDGFVARIVEDISDTIVTIFEACNFQDITGQRITKVVKTLQYIEARVNAMIDIWGADNIADIVPKASMEHKDEESKLLNGPALENQGISQDEIDKLFG